MPLIQFSVNVKATPEGTGVIFQGINVFLLQCADLLFIIFCVPFTASDYVVGIWPFGNVWCKVVQYMVHVCAYSSVYTLVLMSVDRYLGKLLSSGQLLNELLLRRREKTLRLLHVHLGNLISPELRCIKMES